MELKVSHCFIAVHDHREALAFYRDVLGLEVRNDTKDEGMPWVTVGPKAQPDVNIVLEPATANPNAPPQDKQGMSGTCGEPVRRCCRSRWTRARASATARFATHRAIWCASARSGDTELVGIPPRAYFLL
jgi:hypothetical protein